MTWPGFGSGSGRFSITSCSGPPNSLMTMARMIDLRGFGDWRAGKRNSASLLAAQEIADRVGDLIGMRFEREMAGVVKVHLGIMHIAREGFCARRQEKRIILAPHRQQRRLAIAQIFLELRVERDVAGVIKKEIELDLVIAGSRQQGRVEL